MTLIGFKISAVLMDIYTIQLLYLRLRKHCGLRGRIITGAKGIEGFLQDTPPHNVRRNTHEVSPTCLSKHELNMDMLT